MDKQQTALDAAYQLLQRIRLQAAGSESTEEIQKRCAEVMALLREAGDGWELIETAPKDGSQFIGWVPTFYQGKGGYVLCLMLDGEWYDNKAYVIKPTRWRPLPAPPEGK